jgi:2-isopropylmalate synthase
VEEKVEIARMLDEFGVDRIEAGHPLVSPKIEEAVRQIAKAGLSAEVLSHNRAMIKDIEKSLDCGVSAVAIFLGSSDIHLKDKLHFSKEQAIEKVVTSVEYAKAHGLKVRYTPEDATRTEYNYLIELCNAAIDAGAHRIGLADTLGIMQPHAYYDFIRKVRKDLKPCEIEAHCHNDFGMAVANAIAAVRAGADVIHTTINGLGERTGITDMSSFVMAMEILNKTEQGGKWKKYRIEMLPKISSYVEKTSGVFLSPHTPIIGFNAFSHKSGVHTDGVLKNPSTYEPFSPELIGRTRTIVIDRYTGKSAVEERLKQLKIAYTDEQVLKMVMEIKNLGDERKIIHETDIISIAEQITGKRVEIVPDGINAITTVAVESHHFTTPVARKLCNMSGVYRVLEITGDDDISIYIKARNMAELNNVIEEIRSMPGIKDTNTQMVMKRYEGNGNGNGNGNGGSSYNGNALDDNGNGSNGNGKALSGNAIGGNTLGGNSVGGNAQGSNAVGGNTLGSNTVGGNTNGNSH